MLVDDSRLQPSEFCPPYSSSAPAPFLPIRSAWREEYDKAKEDNRRATVGLLADEPRSPIDPENEEVYIAINTLQQAETRTDENVVLCAENAQLDDGIGTNAQEAYKVLYFNKLFIWHSSSQPRAIWILARGGLVTRVWKQAIRVW
jgi:hypothetical protein